MRRDASFLFREQRLVLGLCVVPFLGALGSIVCVGMGPTTANIRISSWICSLCSTGSTLRRVVLCAASSSCFAGGIGTISLGSFILVACCVCRRSVCWWIHLFSCSMSMLCIVNRVSVFVLCVVCCCLVESVWILLFCSIFILFCETNDGCWAKCEGRFVSILRNGFRGENV